MEEKPLCQQYLKAVSIKGDGSIQREQQLPIIIVISDKLTISKREMENQFSSIRIKVANPNRDDITAEQCQRSSCTLGVTQSNEHTRSLLTRTKTTGQLETVSARRHLFTAVHILSNLALIHKKLSGATATLVQPFMLTENKSFS